MGFEPNARSRLRLVYATTSDPWLRQELANGLEEESMSQVPSADLRLDIMRCSSCRPRNAAAPGREELCQVHRGRWNAEACTRVETDREVMTSVYLETLMRRALASDQGGTQFLSAFQRQARALEAVWEAHQRGAVQLPDGVADKVEQARSQVPSFLQGTPAAAAAKA
jgi:hypothetical protein